MSSGRDIAIDRLRHMVEAAKSIARYCARGRATFDGDSAVRDAILYQIVVLGEAPKAVTSADPILASQLPEVEWSLLAKMRDRLTHQYWATDGEIVWSTATRDIPPLLTALTSALERLQ